MLQFANIQLFFFETEAVIGLVHMALALAVFREPVQTKMAHEVITT